MLKRLTALFAIMGSVIANAAAQSVPEQQSLRDLLIPQETVVIAGPAFDFEPDYFGSNDYEIEPEIEFLARFRYGSFDSDGVSIDLIPRTDIAFGPFARLAAPRNEGENDALTGLGDIGRTLELGAAARFTVMEKYLFRLRYLRGIATGHRGTLADAEFSTIVFEGDRVSTLIGLRGTWIGDTFADAFFSVTPEQAEASGQLPVFDAGSGFRDVQLNASARYALTEKWALNGFVRYRRLLGDTAISPIVDIFGSRNQFGLGFSLTRTFVFGDKGRKGDG